MASRYLPNSCQPLRSCERSSDSSAHKRHPNLHIQLLRESPEIAWPLIGRDREPFDQRDLCFVTCLGLTCLIDRGGMKGGKQRGIWGEREQPKKMAREKRKRTGPVNHFKCVNNFQPHKRLTLGNNLLLKTHVQRPTWEWMLGRLLCWCLRMEVAAIWGVIRGLSA